LFLTERANDQAQTTEKDPDRTRVGSSEEASQAEIEQLKLRQESKDQGYDYRALTAPPRVKRSKQR